MTDAFPLPFKDGILDVVVGHEIYSFLDGLSDYNQIRMYPDDQEKTTFINGLKGYNQIQMHPDGQEKTTFITEWDVCVVLVMMFGLKTAQATFQRVIIEIFYDYMPTFMQVFLDDLAVYSWWTHHFKHLQLCLERCRQG